jgi:hypothetical protein
VQRLIRYRHELPVLGTRRRLRADGEGTDTPEEDAYDGANGIRLEALASLGYKFSRCGFWLDLGVDHRIMDVTRTVGGKKEEGNYTFTGPHIGLTCDVYF